MILRRYSCERLVNVLRAGQGGLEADKLGEGMHLFTSFRDVFFMHGVCKMAFSGSDETLQYLKSKIMPLDSERLYTVNHGLRHAAVAIVALREGKKLISQISASANSDAGDALEVVSK